VGESDLKKSCSSMRQASVAPRSKTVELQALQPPAANHPSEESKMRPGKLLGITGAVLVATGGGFGCAADYDEGFDAPIAENTDLALEADPLNPSSEIGQVEQAICTGGCIGTAFLCSSMPRHMCNFQLGCYYDSFGDRCVGTAASCSSIPADECVVQQGCFPVSNCPDPDPPALTPPAILAPRSTTLGVPLRLAVAGWAMGSIQYSALQGGAWTAWSTNAEFTPVEGVNRYRARRCNETTCSSESTVDVEAYAATSNLRSTFSIARTSDGFDASICPVNTAVTGMACSGSYCDWVTPRCGNVLRQVDLNPFPTPLHTDIVWTPYFSEEGGATGICPSGRVMGGIECSGRYCDNIRLACVKNIHVAHPTKCRWSGWFSEEQPPYTGANTGAIVGIQCAGRYCDSKRYYQCDFAAGAQAPGRVPITSTSFDGTWVYMQWDAVPNDPQFSQFVIGERNGSLKWHYQLDEGVSDRGDYRYRYYHRSDICRALGSGTFALSGQVWSGSDASRAGFTNPLGSITCP